MASGTLHRFHGLLTGRVATQWATIPIASALVRRGRLPCGHAPPQPSQSCPCGNRRCSACLSLISTLALWLPGVALHCLLDTPDSRTPGFLDADDPAERVVGIADHVAGLTGDVARRGR